MNTNNQYSSHLRSRSRSRSLSRSRYRTNESYEDMDSYGRTIHRENKYDNQYRNNRKDFELSRNYPRNMEDRQKERLNLIMHKHPWTRSPSPPKESSKNSNSSKTINIPFSRTDLESEYKREISSKRVHNTLSDDEHSSDNSSSSTHSSVVKRKDKKSKKKDKKKEKKSKKDEKRKHKKSRSTDDHNSKYLVREDTESNEIATKFAADVQRSSFTSNNFDQENDDDDFGPKPMIKIQDIVDKKGEVSFDLYSSQLLFICFFCIVFIWRCIITW